MRNSNNAIKFLLAQYRAIFKRAYIKGLATAVLLTAGLAAGQAQADVYLSTKNITDAWGTTHKQYTSENGAISVDGTQIQISDLLDKMEAAQTATSSGDFTEAEQTVASKGLIHISESDVASLGEGDLAFVNVAGASNFTDSGVASGGNLTIGGDNADINGNVIRAKNTNLYNSALGGSAFGGLSLFSGDATASNNTLTIQADKYADGTSAGGYALSESGAATVTGNILNYTSSKVVQTSSELDKSDVSKTLAGGYARANATSDGSIVITDNTLNLGSASNAEATDISAKTYFAGGFGRLHKGSGDATITGNTANLTNITLSSSDAKYIVGGGTDKAATNGTISDNNVVINDSTISGSAIVIAGGFAKTSLSSLTAANNQVTIGADTVVTDASIYSTVVSGNYYDQETNGKVTIAGTYSLGASKTSTIAANDIALSGTLNNAGTLTVQGDTFTASSGTIDNTGTIKFSGDTFTVASDMVAGIFASGDAEAQGKLTLSNGTVFEITGDGEFNLGEEADNITTSSSTLKIAEGTLNLGATLDATKFTNLEANNLKVGDSGSTFAMSGNTVTVHNSIAFETTPTEQTAQTFTIGGASADSTALILDSASTGSLNNIDFTVGGENFSGTLTVQNGAWTGTGDLTVTASGTATIGDDASLSVGKLTAQTANTVSVTGGSLSAADVSLKEKAISVSDTGFLTLEAADVIKEYKAGENDTTSGSVSLTESFASGSAELDTSSTLTLTDANTKLGLTEISATDFQLIRDTVLGDNANGILSLDGVSISIASGDYVEGSTTDIQASAVDKYAGSDTLEDKNIVGVTDQAQSGTNSWGSVELSSGDTLTVGNDSSDAGLTLSKAGDNGYFVATSGGAALANITMSGTSTLTLNNGGIVGNITGADDNNQSVFVDGNGQATTLGNVTQVKDLTVSNGAVTAKDISVTNLTVNSDLTSDVKTEEDDTLYDVTAADLEVAAGASLTTNKLTIGATKDTATASSIAGDVNAVSVVFTNQTGTALANTTEIANGATLTADAVSITSGTTVYVGVDGEESSAGYLDAGVMNLVAGSKLIIDPEYGDPVGLAVAKDFHSDASELNNPDTVFDGKMEGDLLVGKNSAFGLGFDSIAELRAAISAYLNNGSLSDAEGDIGSIVYLNDKVDLGSSGSIYLSANEDRTTLESKSLTDGSVELGANTALIIGEDAVEAAGANGVINSSTGTLTATAADGSKVIFEGAYDANDSVKLFSGSTSVTDTDFKATIVAGAGLLEGKYTSGGTVDFDKAANFNEQLFNTSAPVKALYNDVFDGNYDDGDGAVGADYILQTAANGGGKSVEGTARLATYAGVVQSTLMAQQTSSDTVADRLGMANPNSALIASNNAQGGGLWLAPVYKNSDSDGFEAQGVEYGADINLYGLALGADFTTASGVRVGAMFNLGSGDADGQGIGDGISNDFDYYGFTLYAGMTFGNFSLIADAGFTQLSNDMEQNAYYLGKLTADTDAQSVSVGVRGEYLFATPWVDVVPHVGMRYTNLDLDGYDVKSSNGVVATTDSDSMKVFSIPFGVTFSKDIALGDWSVKPVFDITLTANTGDDELDSTTTFTGVESIALSSEVMDSFTYGTSLGIDAQFKEAFSFGLNVGYTGSSNVDEFGVNANARYTF